MFSVQHQNLRSSPHDGNRRAAFRRPGGKNFFRRDLLSAQEADMLPALKAHLPCAAKMRYKGEPERRAENRQNSVLKMTKK